MIPSPEDHIAITQLLARYCLSLDVDDVEAWVALFTPDGSFEVYGRSWDGHDGLRQMATAAPGGLHLGGPPVIEMIDADHATTKQNLLFVDSSDESARHSVYTDELVRTDAGWRIKKRRTRFITAEGLSDRPPRKPKPAGTA